MPVIVGYVSAMLVGVSLGLLGSGGSILTVPIMVYLLSVSPNDAIVYSLFVVGLTSTVGGLTYINQKLVDWKTVVAFALPSLLVVYFTRKFILPLIPDPVFITGDFSLSKDESILILFSFLMIIAGYRMIYPSRLYRDNADEEGKKNRYVSLLLTGFCTGVLTGLFGIGGGFIIIPALVLFAGVPIKKSVGTSLIIIAFNCVSGFTEEFISRREDIDYLFLLKFSCMSLIGIYLGYRISMRVKAAQLKKIFGWFISVTGIILFIRELIMIN